MKSKGFIITMTIIIAITIILCVFFITRNNNSESKLVADSKETAQKVDNNSETKTKTETKEGTDSKTETKKNAKNTDFLNDDKSYFISIDGKKYYAGDKITDLAKAGFTLRENEKAGNAPAGKYVIGAGNLVNSENVICFSITPYNIEDHDLTIGESVIGGFTLSEAYAKKDEKALNIEVYGGIKLGSTRDEVEKVFGTTDDINDAETYAVYRYHSKEVYRSYTIRFDENDVVDSIEWKNLVFNK